MPLINTYADGYLARHVTTEREQRAAEFVAALGTLPTEPYDWVRDLTVLRAYIITCMECQAEPDDVFASKLSSYRKDFDAALVRARTAQAQADATAGTTPAALFSVPISRA